MTSGMGPQEYPCSFEAGAKCSLDDLPILPEGTLRKKRTLGEALYGKVYLVESGPPGDTHTLAVKKMSRESVLRGGLGIESAQNEIHAALTLRTLQEPVPYTVEMLFAARDEHYFYLAMEHCRHGELFAVLEQNGAFANEAVLREVIWQVLVALKGLHQAGIAHRDISLENLLVADDGTVRLCDFGQAIQIHAPGKIKSEVRVKPSPLGYPGKPLYRPPEIEEDREYSGKAMDMFACGVLLYTLAVGTYPFQCSASRCPYLFPPEERGASRCVHIQGEVVACGVLDQVSPALIDLLEQMLAPCFEKRVTAEEALAHPWLVGTLFGMWLNIDAEEKGELDLADVPDDDVSTAPGSDAGDSTADCDSFC